MQRKPALGLSIALGSLALAGPVDAQWTTSRSDNHRSSRSEVYASQAASPLYPVADVGARPAAGVVQGPSGLVYFSRTTDLQARDPEKLAGMNECLRIASAGGLDRLFPMPTGMHP